MNEIRIGTKDEQTAFRPGELIEGAIGWNLPEELRAIEVRLGWQTRGKGTEDAETVNEIKFDDPPAQGARPFQFVAPDQPYSFSGKLISLIWAIEAVTKPGTDSARIEFIVSPTLAEILLQP